jgi:hypothetical protein
MEYGSAGGTPIFYCPVLPGTRWAETPSPTLFDFGKKGYGQSPDGRLFTQYAVRYQGSTLGHSQPSRA